MANDSSAAGYITPLVAPGYDAALDAILQGAVVGITGLPGNLVRPRWQPEPPIQPDFNTDWCALGVTRSTPDVFSYDRHDPIGNGGNGQTFVEEDELLTVLHSFYGPDSSLNCELFRKGLMITQNRDVLASNGIYLVEVQEAIILPALLKEKWVRRVDATVIYRRRTSTSYAILNLQQSQVTIGNDSFSETANVTNP